MSRPGWELASGGAKETGLTALFKGAALLRHNGEAVSVITALRERTVLLYFAAAWAEPCKSFNNLLCKFYDLVRETDDSIVIIFVSNDKSKEEQVAFFNEGSMHTDWLMAEWTYDLQDIMDSFNVEKIPGLIVVDREGKAVVENGLDQVFDVFVDSRRKPLAPDAVKAAISAKWAEWRRLAGDWRASGGYTLGGGSASGSGSAGDQTVTLGLGLVGPALGQAGAGGQSDREALRAARLAALERRMGGGGAGAQSSGAASSSNSGAASSAGPAPAVEDSTAPAAPAAASAASAAPAPVATSGPRIATTSGGARSVAASGGSGSGTFAAGAAGAPAGGAAYTLAGGRVELPASAPPEAMSGAAFDRSDSDADGMSDMASDGADSAGVDVVEDVDLDEAAANIASMGFPIERAREALQASRGNVDEAVAMLVGDA